MLFTIPDFPGFHSYPSCLMNAKPKQNFSLMQNRIFSLRISDNDTLTHEDDTQKYFKVRQLFVNRLSLRGRCAWTMYIYVASNEYFYHVNIFVLVVYEIF